MNVSVIIPAQSFESDALGRTLDGISAQRYDAGSIEVLAVRYGNNGNVTLPSSLPVAARLFSVDHPSPYRARNVAAAEAGGDLFLFTEPGCVPEHDWIDAHATAMRDQQITVSVGRVIGETMSKSADMFISYEDTRDDWVFSGNSWPHYFGRPKNMAVARRRFETHGPFVEVMRGGDSKLVQRIARDVSTDEIAFTPAAVVRQSSVHGFPGLMQERFAHARALRMYRSSHAAPLDFDQRISIFRETAAAHDHGLLDAAKLMLLLSAGRWAFRLGTLSGSGALAIRSLRQRLASGRDSGSL